MSVVEARFVQVLLALLCWIFLIMQTLHIDRFARESRDFEAVRITAEPGQRALALVFDAASAASHNPWAYLHYPLWYQAENKGFVDFNFAWSKAQIVRFRSDRLPAIQTDFSMGPGAFNWTQHEGWRYRYFFVRNTKPLPADLFKNDQCQVDLVRSAGNWSLFEASRCH